MVRRSFASLVALASFALIAAAPTAARAALRDQAASLGAMRGTHADLTAVGEDASTDLPIAGDERESVRDQAQIVPTSKETERRWYGWETLTMDAVSIAAMPVAGVGVGGYLLGAPIIHAAHDRWGIAAASLGLRVGLPIVGAMAGVKLENCPKAGQYDEGMCGLGGALLGMGVGMLTAIIIDAAVLSYERVPATSANATSGGSARATSTTSVAIAPWIERDRKGASLAVTF